MASAVDLFAHIPEDFGGRQKPLFFIEPKDRNPAPELERQSGFVVHLRKHTRCGVFAVPNGGLRSRWEKARAVKEGLVLGAADLVVWWQFPGIAFPEFKDGDGMPDVDQIAFGNSLIRAGHHYGVFRTKNRCLEWLRGLGAPV